MWAGGNGGDGDNCGADGFSTSIYTIAVGAVSVTGEQAWFDETCSAKMVVNYVTDAGGNAAVVCSEIVSRVDMCKLRYYCIPEYNSHWWRVYHFFWWNKFCNSNGKWDHCSHFRSKVSPILSMIGTLCATHVYYM